MSRLKYKVKVRRVLMAVFATAVAVQFSHSVPQADAFHTQRQRYASRMLKITPRDCTSPNYPDIIGVCMISLECNQRNGMVIGACRDGHLFGACCHDAQAQLKSSMATEAPTTTTTTTEAAFPTGSGSSQQENNEVIHLSIDSEAQLDSQTQIPSLIDTFSELSPTFLSELALDDEHTTGIYSLPQEDIQGEDQKEEIDEEDKEQQFLLQRQKMEEILAETSSAANMISTEDTMMVTSTDRNPRTSTSTERYHGLDENGGIGGGVAIEVDDDFKDNMIKYIDEIVTMRNTQPPPPVIVKSEVPSSPSPPPPVVVMSDILSSPPPPQPLPSALPLVVEPAVPPGKVPASVEEDMPFSTFTIVTSTKPAEDGGEIRISSITTTGSGDIMLPMTTTPVPAPASEETVSASVAQSIAALPSSTESNEIRDSTEQPQMSSVQPTKFTFSKLKYSPKTYQPRSTTEKVIWTRPPVHTQAPYNDNKLVDLDEDEDEEEEEDDHHNEKVEVSSGSSSSSTQATSVEQTTIASSSSTEGYYSPGYYEPEHDSEDNVEEHNYNGGTIETTSTPQQQQQEQQDYSSSYYSTYDPASYTPSSYLSSSSYAPNSYIPSSYAPNSYTANSYAASSYDPDGYPPSSYPQSSYPPSSYTPSSYLSSSYPSSNYTSNGYTPNSYLSSSYPSSNYTSNGYTPSSYLSSSYPPSSNTPSNYTSNGNTQYSYFSSSFTPSNYTSSLATSPNAPVEVEESAVPTTEYFNFDWTSPTIMSLLKGATEAAALYYAKQKNASERSDIDSQAFGGSTTENELDSPMSSSSSSPLGISSSTWRTTGPSSNGVSSSTLKTTSGVPQRADWDSSIDSFVDQVVDGIVQDLNKSNKIDEMIFKKQQQRSSVPTAKTPVLTSTSTEKLKLASSTERSVSGEKRKFKKTPRPKGKVKTSTEKVTTSTEVSTTEKQKMKKVTTKTPNQNKRRITKNKAKPVKKVTTTEIKSANNTRKRLDYKKDCGVRPLIKKGRIVGGTPSTFGSWPWHALVKETVWWGIFSKIKCGGVLIGAQHVLTAAHCQPQQTGTLSVVLGITDSDDTDTRAVTKQVKRVIPHPQFNARTYENDIMILELDSPVDFQPHVVPICLPKEDDELEGKTAYVTGMGLLKHDGERPLILQEVDLPILNNTECQKMFVRSGNKKPIIDSFICAGYELGRKDSCGGDSGGPLSVKRSNGQWVLAGTVSHGIKCALPDQPGVYMRTSYYKPWIDRVLNVARSKYRGIQRCNAPPMICARQRHQQQLRRHQQQPRQDNGFVNTLFRIFRLARKMVDERRSSG